ncbi:MAG: hypothetical protein ACRBFS_11995 [Aureispira sp.]
MILDWVKVTQVPDSVATSSFVENYLYPTLDLGETSLAESTIFQRSRLALPALFDDAFFFKGKQYLDFKTVYSVAIFHQYTSTIPNYFEHDFIDNFLITPSDVFDGTSTIQLEEGDLKITIGARWIY